MISLVNRSHFSLMRATASAKELVKDAKNKGWKALAITDRDNLYGLWAFLKACEDNWIIPIIGVEVSCPKSSSCSILLAQNQEGYGNLCKITTDRKMSKEFQCAESFIKNQKGLVFLISCPKLLTDLNHKLKHIFALIRHRPSKENESLRNIAQSLKVPLVAAPAPYFLEPEDYSVHKVLRAISQNQSLSRLNPEELCPDYAFLPNTENFKKNFTMYPEAISNINKVFNLISLRKPQNQIILPPWSGHEHACLELKKRAFAGAKTRYGSINQEIKNRLVHELKIIHKKQFCSYFLVVRKIVAHNPRICGRGSGAASLVSYCLDITNVCPLKNKLYFERFLNPGRSDPPDIDVDFAWDERDEVLNKVLTENGHRAAMVSSHVLFQPRMALREVAKVFGLPEAEIGRITKKLPFLFSSQRKNFLQSKIQKLPQFKNHSFPKPWPEIIEISAKILGCPRHISVHPGGVVISHKAMSEHVPLEMAKKGLPIINWDKDGAEDGGLVKIDLLGNRSLGVIRDAISNLVEDGYPWNERSWRPEDDPITQKFLAEGKTMGCFYIESPSMRLLQKKSGKGDFEHLVIHSSIIRPAANEFINEYLRRLHGGAWEPIHPLLKNLLHESYGIMVYQEDVSKAAVALAGFSHSDADRLRKIISKKDKEKELGDYRLSFYKGAGLRGLSGSQIKKVWAMIMSFAGYSFCKPHSASYAKVSFQAAYLKVHYPAHFMAAVISNQGGYYSRFAYISEAKRLGVKILGPDVHQSKIRFYAKGMSMRVGLMAIYALGHKTQETIVREANLQNFRHIFDFLFRIKPSEEEFSHLCHSGALDSLNPQPNLKNNRNSLFWYFYLWQKQKQTKNSSFDLFPELVSLKTPAFPRQSEVHRIFNEFSSLGFLCQHHPMQLFEKKLHKISQNRLLVKAYELEKYPNQILSFAGILLSGKIAHTKKGEVMEFITFEDETALAECTYFPKAYEQACPVLERGRAFILKGKVEIHFGAITFTVVHTDLLTLDTNEYSLEKPSY